MTIRNKTIGILAAGGIAASAIVTAFATPAFAADDLKSWQKEIVQLVAKKQVYPRAALSREIEGRAKVKVTVDRSGAISSHEILEATGHDVLDNEIGSLVERLNPLPTPPSDIADENLSFVLPLAWIIQ